MNNRGCAKFTFAEYVGESTEKNTLPLFSEEERMLLYLVTSVLLARYLQSLEGGKSLGEVGSRLENLLLRVPIQKSIRDLVTRLDVVALPAPPKAIGSLRRSL